MDRVWGGDGDGDGMVGGLPDTRLQRLQRLPGWHREGRETVRSMCTDSDVMISDVTESNVIKSDLTNSATAGRLCAKS